MIKKCDAIIHSIFLSEAIFDSVSAAYGYETEIHDFLVDVDLLSNVPHFQREDSLERLKRAGESAERVFSLQKDLFELAKQQGCIEDIRDFIVNCEKYAEISKKVEKEHHPSEELPPLSFKKLCKAFRDAFAFRTRPWAYTF